MSREQEFLNAAKTGDQETFIRILNDQSINIDPNHVDKQGVTALIWAAVWGQINIVRILLADTRVDPNRADKVGNTALIAAICWSRGNIVRVLLDDARVDPNQADEDCRTALMEAARRGRSNIVCALLADERVDPNQADEDCRTALMEAARRGCSNIVRALVADTRVDPNRTNRWGQTALFYAAPRGHSDTVRALIDDPRIDFSHAGQAKKAIKLAAKHKQDKTLSLLLRFSGQRLSVDEIANLANSDQDFYKSILNRLFRRARFRGIVRSIVIFRRRRLHAAQAVYAPGGTGYAAAATSFATAASQQSSSTGTLISTETNDTTASIVQTSDEPGKPLTKK
ncbi:MAG: ankyrin repeat domain-containing protein [Pseudomonadota bacterium]|nr:ankyrin repeat domain-containing protein [Pseudomonadota bacterium]